MARFPTAETLYRFPAMIFIKRPDRTGFGFFYDSEAAFEKAFKRYAAPIEKVIEEKIATLETLKEGGFRREDLDTEKLRNHASILFMEDVLNARLEKEITPEGIRWAAAMVARHTPFTGQGYFYPSAVMIEYNSEHNIVVRRGDEFVEKTPARSHPLAVILGSPQEGGGPGWFFSSAQEWQTARAKHLDEATWLPKLIGPLYASPAPVIFARPLRAAPKDRFSLKLTSYDFSNLRPLTAPAPPRA